MPDLEEPTLFRGTSESRDGSFEAHALEQYKLRMLDERIPGELR